MELRAQEDKEKPEMSEIVSVPSSVRVRLEQAETLLAQNRPREAEAAFKAAGSELARTQPELATMLVAAQMGHRDIAAAIKEVKTTTERVERRVLGVKVGEQRVPKTTTREVLLRLKLD
jgi:ABC-type oligopeptide transport system substrate-binding subunit